MNGLVILLVLNLTSNNVNSDNEPILKKNKNKQKIKGALLDIMDLDTD